MNIAVHTSHYPYDDHRPGYVSGGGERVARSLAEAHAARGHEVTVYTASDRSPSRTRRNGVDVIRRRSIARIGDTSVAPGQFVPSRRQVDVVHVHNTTPPGVISGYLHARTVDAPLVLTHHGNDRYVPDGSLLKRALDYLYAERLLDHVLNAADHITIPSLPYLQESERLRRLGSKVSEIPNGIDVERYDRPETATSVADTFEVDPDDTLVLFVGDLIPKKGPDLLVEAATALDETTFVVAGDGDMLADLRRDAPDCVRLPGYVSEAQKIALLNRADLFCLPSRTRTEVFPLVILEAYASRTPVITSDLGTFDGLVTDETGARFEHDDVEDLVATIRDLSSSPQTTREKATKAREAAEQYQWPAIAERYETAFESVIET